MAFNITFPVSGTTPYCLDANIFLSGSHGRDYDIDIFCSLWNKLAEHKQDIILIKPIYDEIEPMSSQNRQDLTRADKMKKYPVRMLLEEHFSGPTSINDEVQHVAIKLEKKYEAANDSIGAGKNDIALIAYAKVNNYTVVTLEKLNSGAKKRNYKIPTICNEESVRCINFIQFLTKLGITI